MTRSLRTPTRAVALLFFASGGLLGAWAARVPAFADRFALDHGALGLALLALAGAAVVSFPLAGAACDRLGAANVARFMAWASFFALPLVGLAPTLPMMVAALALFGATFGALDVAMNAYGVEVEKATERPILSSLHALFSLGAGAGSAVAGVAAGAALAPEAHFALWALALAAITLPFAHLPWARPAREPREGGGFRLPKGALAIVGLVAFVGAFGEGTIADWSVLLLERAFGAEPSHAAFGFTLFSLAMVAMRLLGDPLRARIGAVALGRGGSASALAGGLLLASADGLVAAYAGLTLLGLGYATLVPLAFVRAAEDPSMEPGASIAIMSIFVYGGLLCAPPLIGFVADATSLQAAFWLLPAGALAAAFGAGAFTAKRP